MGSTPPTLPTPLMPAMRSVPVPQPPAASRPRPAPWATLAALALTALLAGCGAGDGGGAGAPSAGQDTAAATGAPSPSATPGSATTHAAAVAGVEAMLARGADAWNRGDLDAFVSDYVAGDSATYIGRTGIVRGRAAIRASYAPRFASGVERGTLRFEQLEVDVLAPGVANAIAWYVLSKGDSVIARGPTSLVTREVGGRWLIVHDHSS